MSDEPAQNPPETSSELTRDTPLPQRRRILWRLFLGFCVFSAIAFALLSWYVTTDSFQRIVRRRVIAAAEKLTGGRVELGELHTIPFRLRVDVRNLTIHGHEDPDQAPFLRVDRVQAEMKIISLLSTTVGLHSLVLEHPVLHIIDYPDGSTNAPVPPAHVSSNQQPVEQLLSLSVSHIEVQRGELLWEDKRVPFDFDGRELALLLHYSLLRRQYEAHLSAGVVDTHLQDLPQFTWRADASLVLARKRIDIKSLTAASGKSEIHFTGQLQDFHNPQVVGDYRGVADLEEFVALARQTQVRKGTAQFEGKVSWSLQTFSTDGSVQAKDIEWSNRKVSMRNGRIAAGFSLTPDRFRLSAIKANLLGGDLQGDAEVVNWQSSIPSLHVNPHENGSPSTSRRRITTSAQASQQRGSVRLQLAGFPLLPAMQFLSSKKLPLDQLNLAGSTSGNVEMQWKGSFDEAEVHLKLGVVPPQKSVPGEIPVLGQIDAVYRGARDELEMSEFHLTTPGSEVTATGTLAANLSPSAAASSSSSSSLRFSITSHNLKEWTPLLEAAYASSSAGRPNQGSPALPVAVHGWAKLAGNASGRLSALSVTGNLEVYDFDTTLPATQRAPARAIHWDAVTAAVQFSSNHFATRNASLIHGHTTAHFDASADLSEGLFQENSAFTLHLDARGAELAELMLWAGETPPPGRLAGTLDISATLSGRRASPHGDGHLVLHNGIAYGVTVPLLSSDLRLSNGELQLNKIDASAFDAPLSGNAAIGITSSDFSKSEFRLALAGRNLDLAHFPRLQNGRLRAEGVTDFTVRMSGTPQQPSLEAHVHLKDLALDQERFGEFYIDTVTHGRQLELTSHSGFDRGDLSIAGSVGLDHDLPADLNLGFHQLDVDALLRVYLPGALTGHSQLDGTLRLVGPLRNPRELKATAELQSFAVKINNVEVQSQGPIRLEVADQMLLVEALHFAGSGTDFTAHGRAHLGGARELDLRLDGSVNMTLFQSLNPKILARGTLGVNLNAGGTLSQPVLQGRLEVKNTFLSHNDFPSGLSDMNGVLQFDRNRIQIESLSGTTGGGNVALTGAATYQGGVFLLDFGATAQGVRLRYPPGVSSTESAPMSLAPLRLCATHKFLCTEPQRGGAESAQGRQHHR